MNEKRTSEDWQASDEFKAIIIMDPDGWRDGTCDFENDKITKDEFIKRKNQCTCMFYKKENNSDTASK